MLIQRGKHSNTTNSTVGIRDANLWRSQIWRFFFGPAPLLIEFANAPPPPLQKMSFFDLFSPVSTSILKIIPSNHRPPPLLYFFQLCQPICHLSRGVHISPVYTERYRVIFDIVFITLWFPNFIRILTPFIKVRNSGQEESPRLMSTAKSPFF